MKIIAIIITSLICSASLYCQSTLSTFITSYDGKEKTIQIATDKKDSTYFTLWIESKSFDNLYKKGSFEIDKKKYNNFFEALKEAELKYVEWVKTAKDNNVKELDKILTTKCKGSATFFASEWHYDYDVNISFRFKILTKDTTTTYGLIIESGKLTSKKNQFITNEGLYLFFVTDEEIKNFISSVSSEKITEYIKKPKVENLFKN